MFRVITFVKAQFSYSSESFKCIYCWIVYVPEGIISFSCAKPLNHPQEPCTRDVVYIFTEPVLKF